MERCVFSKHWINLLLIWIMCGGPQCCISQNPIVPKTTLPAPTITSDRPRIEDVTDVVASSGDDVTSPNNDVTTDSIITKTRTSAGNSSISSTNTTTTTIVPSTSFTSERSSIISRITSEKQVTPTPLPSTTRGDITPSTTSTTTTTATVSTRTSAEVTNDCNKCHFQDSTFGTHGVLAFSITLSLLFLLMYALLMIMVMPKIITRSYRGNRGPSLDLETQGYRRKQSNFSVELDYLGPMANRAKRASEPSRMEPHSESTVVPKESNIGEESEVEEVEEEQEAEEDDHLLSTANVSTFLIRHPSLTPQDPASKPQNIPGSPTEPNLGAVPEQSPGQDKTSSNGQPPVDIEAGSRLPLPHDAVASEYISSSL